MVTYPIIIRPFHREQGHFLVIFPDFPSCSEQFRITDLPTDDEEAQQIILSRAKAVATEYLIGSAQRPGWIVTRLKAGYIVASPGTYPVDNRDQDLTAEIDLPDHMGWALQFLWLCLRQGLDAQAMAAKLDIGLKRLEQIWYEAGRPNHRERARLENLQLRLQQSLAAQAAQDENEPPPEDLWYDEAASF